MKVRRLICSILLLFAVVVISGCGGAGGGGGDSGTNGSLSVSATVSGSQIKAIAKYTNPLTSNPIGLKVTFSSKSGLIKTRTVSVDSSGNAVAILAIEGVPAVNTIDIVAQTGNLRDSVDVTLTLPSLSLSLDTRSANLIKATAIYSNTYASTNKGIDVDFYSSNSSIFDPITKQTDIEGKVETILVPKNTVTVPTDVYIYARVGTQTQYALVTVKPQTLTVSAPPGDEETVEGGTPGSYVEFVPSGVENFTIVNTADGYPVANADVTLEISTIIGGPGFIVFYTGYPPVADPVATSLTLKTDSYGKFPLQASVAVMVPDPDMTNTLTVVWKVSYLSPSGKLYAYASSQYSVTNSAGTPPTPPVALAVTPAVNTFSAEEPAGSTKVFTVSGGTGPYTAVSSDTGLVSVFVSGTSVVATRVENILAGNATITVSDSAGASVPVLVTVIPLTP